MRRAVFLDRDGVIIENRADHVKRWSEVRFLEGAIAAIQRLAASPFAIVIVSNQGLIGRGLLDEATVWHLHRRIVHKIEMDGGRIDASYLCPHHPDFGCTCRKPAPGLLRQAATDLGLELSGSWLVGDALSDLQAAHAVGARGILVRTGRGMEQLTRMAESSTRCSWPVSEDLSGAVQHILAGGTCMTENVS
jgi:D-glycero-D-manno-heptose 1,7-bisphosphate phosphatase